MFFPLKFIPHTRCQRLEMERLMEIIVVDQTVITPGLDYDSDEGNMRGKWMSGNSEAESTGLS